ncbi:uncharacterized protein LOC143033729 [Oratosquilla oratoria]|uniref:uncharacterized protein LOC143033729 n=1 Tax=Oratosquilla oratoria TaxID=337810 RepID=UPI003F76DB56
MAASIQEKCPFVLSGFDLGTNEDHYESRIRTRSLKQNNNNYIHQEPVPSGKCPVFGNGICTGPEFVEESAEDKHTKKLPPMSPRMAQLLEGKNHPGDCGNPIRVPHWLDREKFDRGRRFFKKYMFCVFFSDLISLILVSCLGRLQRVLIYTGRSDTVIRSFHRYVSTALHVLTWYIGNIWDPNDQAHADILKIRKIHLRYGQLLNSTKTHAKVDTVSVESRGHMPVAHSLNPTIRRDLRLHNKRIGPSVPIDPPNRDDTIYISQMDMALTQYAFFGLLVTHPRMLGLWWVSHQDLEGLVHFWRGVGWLLGISDKYNLCSGTLDETVALCQEIEELVLKPNLASVHWDYEHMSECLVRGTNLYIPCLSVPVLFRFLATILGLRVPELTATMSWTYSAHYWTMRFVFHVLFAVVPGIIKFMNKILSYTLELVQGKKKDKHIKVPIAKPLIYW